MNGFVFVFVYLRWGQTRLMGAALEDKEMEEVEEEGSWQWIRFSLSSGFIFVNRSRWRTGVLFPAQVQGGVDFSQAVRTDDGRLCVVKVWRLWRICEK